MPDFLIILSVLIKWALVIISWTLVLCKWTLVTNYTSSARNFIRLELIKQYFPVYVTFSLPPLLPFVKA